MEFLFPSSEKAFLLVVLKNSFTGFMIFKIHRLYNAIEIVIKIQEFSL